MREFLAHCADVNIKDNGGLTPVMCASAKGRLAVVRLLCDAPEIDLAARSSSGRTALGWALTNTPRSRPYCARAACPSEHSSALQ